MSNVPKSQRHGSNFEAEHHLFRLRDTVTALMMNDFGYSEEKYLEYIEWYRRSHEGSCENIDELVEKHMVRCRAFHKWFIETERNTISDILRIIQEEFTTGNSIFISETQAKFREFKERRIHIDLSIAKCYLLKHEIQYVIRTLPVDNNKFCRFDDMIEKQISLIKGVRKSDNRKFRSILKKDKQKNKKN